MKMIGRVFSQHMIAEIVAGYLEHPRHRNSVIELLLFSLVNAIILGVQEFERKQFQEIITQAKQTDPDSMAALDQVSQAVDRLDFIINRDG